MPVDVEVRFCDIVPESWNGKPVPGQISSWELWCWLPSFPPAGIHLLTAIPITVIRMTVISLVAIMPQMVVLKTVLPNEPRGALLLDQLPLAAQDARHKDFAAAAWAAVVHGIFYL